MLYDVGYLLAEEPWVDGVAHEAGPGHAVIQFHVPIVVPRQSADAVSGLQTTARERPRELSAAPGEVRVGVEVVAAFHRGGSHIGVTVIRVSNPQLYFRSEERRVGDEWVWPVIK